MKTCTRCRIEKPEAEFTFRAKAKDKLNPACKDCHRAYTRDHYAKNKAYYVDKAMVWNAGRLDELTALINEAKSKPCVDCGRSFPPVAMDLDHVRGKKVMDVAIMRKHHVSVERIRAEIAKCEVRCAVCHRLRTHL